MAFNSLFKKQNNEKTKTLLNTNLVLIYIINRNSIILIIRIYYTQLNILIMKRDTLNRIRENISIARYNKGYTLLQPEEKLDVTERIVFILKSELEDMQAEESFNSKLTLICLIIIGIAAIISTKLI